MNPRPVSYLQTDPRWGSLDYSARGEKTNIAVSGCGPTALAMVLATWVDPKITPKSECAWALAQWPSFSLQSGSAWLAAWRRAFSNNV